MRKIKFRAWAKLYNKMYCPILGIDWETNTIILTHKEAHAFDHVELMQFTGLYDKNGKEIWEGDCFKTSDQHGYSSNCIAEVIFMDGCFIVHIHRSDLIQIFKCLDRYLEQYVDSTEIIGNVYENPELMEDKK